MRLKTIINHCSKFNNFVFEDAHFNEKSDAIIIPVRPRKGSKAICSGCQQPAPGYDKLDQRRFQFVPFWGLAVFFLYTMRRVNCPNCGVKVEQVPWAAGKSPITHIFAKYLAGWAKVLPVKTVATRFKVSWQVVCTAIKEVVDFGLKNRVLGQVEAIGVDEVQYHKGHKYMTLVYDITAGYRRLLWVGKERTKKTFRKFFSTMWKKDRKFHKNIQVICTDMWQAYIEVAKERIPQALNILDRFHIMQKFGKALDELRRAEVKRLRKKEKKAVLKNSRWCLLKRAFNLSRKQKGKLKEVLAQNETLQKAYLLKEMFHQFWEYKSPTWAGKFLDKWCEIVRETEIPQLIKVAEMLEGRRELILNYFKSGKRYSSGAVEGLNRRVNLVIRQGFGYRSFEMLETVLYHQMGKLPEPDYGHDFW